MLLGLKCIKRSGVRPSINVGEVVWRPLDDPGLLAMLGIQQVGDAAWKTFADKGVSADGCWQALNLREALDELLKQQLVAAVSEDPPTVEPRRRK